MSMDICLMGVPKAGKTSIAKVIFQRMNPKQTMTLEETTKVECFEFKVQSLLFRLYDFPGDYDINEAPPNEQMILEGCSAVIFVISALSQPFADSYEMLFNIASYIQNNNNNKCSFHIFLHKAETEVIREDDRKDMLLRTKTQTMEYLQTSDIKMKTAPEFYLTTIYDYSIFEAVSQVVQRVLPCSSHISKLLEEVCITSKIEKIYLFDIITRLYFGTNSTKAEAARHEICAQMIDVFIDISLLYPADKKHEENNSKAIIKLNTNDSDDAHVLLLKCVDMFLAVVCIIKEVNYDHPYLIDYNIDVFKKGMYDLLQVTSQAALK